MFSPFFYFHTVPYKNIGENRRSVKPIKILLTFQPPPVEFSEKNNYNKTIPSIYN